MYAYSSRPNLKVNNDNNNHNKRKTNNLQYLKKKNAGQLPTI